MAWTTPSTRATGDLITAALWNTDLVDNLQFLYDNNLRGHYDSGWFAVTTGTTYNKAHGLGQTPRLWVVQHAVVAAPGSADEINIWNWGESSAGSYRGVGFGANGTNVVITTTAHQIISDSRRLSNTGYMRVLAWK